MTTTLPELDKDTYWPFIREAAVAGVLLFATWDPRYRSIEADLAALAATLPAVRFAKLEGDDWNFSDLLKATSVADLPCVLLYRRGEYAQTLNGVRGRDEYAGFLQALLNR